MLETVYIDHFLSEGIAYLRAYNDWSLWTRAKVRKTHTCIVSGIPIEVGDVAWRPIGNQIYRGKRISNAVMQNAWKQSQEEEGDA